MYSYFQVACFNHDLQLSHTWTSDIVNTIYDLSGRILKVVASHDEGCKVARSNPVAVAELHRFILAQGAQGVQPMRVGGATTQLDLPSLTPLSIAGCGRTWEFPIELLQ